MFHFAAAVGNDSFTNYLVKIAEKTTDETTEGDIQKVHHLLHQKDNDENTAIHSAAAYRKKGVVNVLLGATNNKSDDVSNDVSVHKFHDRTIIL